MKILLDSLFKVILRWWDNEFIMNSIALAKVAFKFDI